MSTENNTLIEVNPSVSEERKKECEDELVEASPRSSISSYDFDLGASENDYDLGSSEKPTDEQLSDDQYSSTKTDEEQSEEMKEQNADPSIVPKPDIEPKQKSDPVSPVVKDSP